MLLDKFKVPETWKELALDSCCDVINGSISYKQLLITSESYGGESIPCMGVKVSDMNLFGNEQIFARSLLMKRVPIELAYRKMIPPQCVVFPKRGAAISTNKKRLTTAWTVLDPNLIALRPKQGIWPLFLFYWAQTLDLRKVTSPGPTPQLNKKDLTPIRLIVPESLAEQRKIAAILSLVQRAIEQQDRLLALTAELKKALLHKLFTEGLHGEPQKHTQFGPVPQSWTILSLNQCATVQTGIAKGRKVDPKVAITVPYLRVANVQSGYLDLTEIKNIQIRRDELSRYLLQKGDVVLTEGGDFDKLGRGFIWNGETDNFVHQNHIFAVRVNRSQLMPEYLAYLAQSGYGKSYFLSVAHKTTNLACINTSKLKAFPVPIPPLEEQRSIVDLLQLSDKKHSAHSRKRAALRDLFRTLLHQLMTAQVRVNHLDLSEVEKLLA